jgi:hypothetical protein
MSTQFPATRTVHCPNGPVHACDDHAANITGLMAFLGIHAVHTAAPDNAECENCVNAAKVEHQREKP